MECSILVIGFLQFKISKSVFQLILLKSIEFDLAHLIEIFTNLLTDKDKMVI